MSYRTLSVLIVLSAISAAIAGEPPKDQLPPGFTADDMKAMMEAGTPGKMQALLAAEKGAWEGTSTMRMGSESPGTSGPVKSTVTPLMDGRYTRVEVTGEVPGMGPYKGEGTYGYDNVAKKFVCTWIDSMSTGFMTGEGELSADGKLLTWTFNYNCPITKKPQTMKQTETIGSDKKVLEMTGADPKTGKEFRMNHIELTRK